MDHQIPACGDDSLAMSSQLAEIANAVRMVSSKVGSFEASLQSVKANLKTLESKVALNEPSKGWVAETVSSVTSQVTNSRTAPRSPTAMSRQRAK